MEFAITYILIPLIKIALILAIVPGYVAVITYAERKIIAFMQVRLGPMRVGPYGLLQMVADPLKLLLKEDIVPERADRWIFTLAPVICLIPAFIVLAVIPFGSSITIRKRSGELTMVNARAMAVKHTDLPEPVVPAISKWGMVARFVTNDAPPTSRPSGMINGDSTVTDGFSGSLWL